MTEKSFDIMIVGAGPAGFSAGIYAARANIPTIIFGNPYESQVAKGGVVENYPGFTGDGIDGIALIERMLEQAEFWGCTVDFDLVTNITKEEDGTFAIKTEEKEYRGTTVVLAMGATPRKLNIPGEKELERYGVSYCTVCDGALYRERNVALVGRGTGLGKGGVYMIPLAKHIELLNTDEILKTEQTYIQRMDKASNMNVVHNVAPVEILGDTRVTGFTYRDNEDTLVTVDVDAVFVEAGTLPNYELAERLGIELTENNFIRVNRMTQKTNMEGVFAAGDITGGRRQIAVAVGEGSSAGISAIRYVGVQG